MNKQMHSDVWPDDEKFRAARVARDAACGPLVHLRGVVEFTNICGRSCHYCGMRVQNSQLKRYALDGSTLVERAMAVADDGLNTVMIQGGDHLKYDVELLCDAIREIGERSGIQVLLCVGDRPFSDYERLFAAGARQAIVKFETSNERLYKQLRPHSRLEQRVDLIRSLAHLGYGVSSGFIVGLPSTDQNDIERDLELTLSLPLFAASVSPFIGGENTPLGQFEPPKLRTLLECISYLRVQRPNFLIPSVSALNLLDRDFASDSEGQLAGLWAGANVLTVNYTPSNGRDQYQIYRQQRFVVELSYARDIVKKAGLTMEKVNYPRQSQGLSFVSTSKER